MKLRDDKNVNINRQRCALPNTGADPTSVKAQCVT